MMENQRCIQLGGSTQGLYKV